MKPKTETNQNVNSNIHGAFDQDQSEASTALLMLRRDLGIGSAPGSAEPSRSPVRAPDHLSSIGSSSGMGGDMRERETAGGGGRMRVLDLLS